MIPIGPIVTAFVVVVLALCAGLFWLIYAWNRKNPAPSFADREVLPQPLRQPISLLFYFAALSCVALAIFSYLVNRAALLRHFAPETPNREYWSRTDALIASVPYLVLLIPAILAHSRPWLLAALIAVVVVAALPYLRETLSPSSPAHSGVYNDYEWNVIDRTIVHSALVLLFSCGIAGWALGRQVRGNPA